MSDTKVLSIKAGTLIHIAGMPFKVLFDTDLVGNENNLEYALNYRDEPKVSYGEVKENELD